MRAVRVLVYGLGRSGTAVAALLAKQGHQLIAFDQAPEAAEVEQLTRLGGHLVTKPLEAEIDLCIAAPGVPFDHPDLVALRARNIETIGEVEWVARTVNADLIGITGTAGKTSTTAWLHTVLHHAGLNVRMGGNIDPALAAVAEDGALLVAELSSFGLERSPTLKPRIAIVLNLGADHIDRHGSVENYHAAKRAIIQNQSAEDYFVYNADDPVLCEWASAAQAQTLAFSGKRPADAHLQANTLYLHGEVLLGAHEVKLGGQHQLSNALAVMLAATACGVDRDQLKQGLTSFNGIAGRYSEVARLGKIRFIEDSIATRSLAVQAALEATEAPIVWILGGADKGATFSELKPIVKDKVSLAIGVGAAGQVFLAQLENLTATFFCSQQDGRAALLAACQKAVSHLRHHHEGQGAVLLAPLAASFDQFRDYKDRATVFREVVTQLVKSEAIS